MELYAKGQLSFLILTCMQERDFYGLDIISEIRDRSNGRINLKKPSVYSNLTRMEKLGYISSYLKNSDLGPNRKYYSLTEKGRGFYQELKSYFESNSIDVFRDFEDQDEKIETPTTLLNQEDKEETKEENLFFDFSSLNQEDDNKEDEEDAGEAEDEQQLNQENQKDISNEKQQNDDAVFLTQENVNDYNKRLYDISKDINKIRRKRSFADDQIAMTATAPLFESNEKVKNNIQDFKNSLLENREKFQENKTSSFEHFKQKENQESKLNQLPESHSSEEAIKDDARFITNRIDASKVERAKKIEPPRLKIVSENTKDIRLPAPKRDKSIDPSHREILNKLYSRTKDINSPESRSDAIYDYNDLKDYYKSQEISFNVYHNL